MPPLIDSAPDRTASTICPPNSWDVHHHIFDLVNFPLSPTRHFTPSAAPMAEFEKFQHSLGIEHVCIAHGMSYGVDSSSLLHYLDHFQGSARAYACIDESVTKETMRQMKTKVRDGGDLSSKQGVIGIRIDFHLHKAQHDVTEQIRCLRTYAERVAPIGWGLQIYSPHPEYYAVLDPVIRSLSTSLVVDHFAGLKTKSLLEYMGQDASGFNSATQPGMSELCALLHDNKLWIKLSAPYRCSEDPTYEDMRPIVRALVEANPNRVLYGSDWPHTQPFHRRPAGLKGTDVETFVQFDDVAWLRTLCSWLSETEWRKLMVENPRKFTQYS